VVLLTIKMVALKPNSHKFECCSKTTFYINVFIS
jgi:hypothetical protein